MKNLKSLIFLAMLGCMLGASAATPKVVAHRGFWDTPGAAQNSLAALAKADSIGSDAAELDVWLTADGVLVVNHDADINGITIEDADAPTVLAQTLANGETVPTLEAYLQRASGLTCGLVLELKTHTSRKQERRAVDDIMALVKKYGLENRTDYITFSKDAFDLLIKKAPEGAGVYYLSGDYIPAQIKAKGAAGIDYSLRTMRRHPEWIKECHDAGLLVNIWTVNTADDLQWCIDMGADLITTNNPLLLQQMLK